MSLIKRLFLETIDQERIEIDEEYCKRMNQIKYYNYEQERHDKISIRGNACAGKETLSMDEQEYTKHHKKCQYISK